MPHFFYEVNHVCSVDLKSRFKFLKETSFYICIFEAQTEVF